MKCKPIIIFPAAVHVFLNFLLFFFCLETDDDDYIFLDI